MMTLPKSKTMTLIVSLIILWLLKIVSSQAAQAASTIETSPEWLAPVLGAVSSVLGAIALVVLLGLVVMHGRQLIALITSAFTDPDNQTEKSGPNEPGPDKEAVGATKDLAKTVLAMERYGNKSGDLIKDAQLQAVALVDLVKALSAKSAEMRQNAESFREALEAIVGNDYLQMAHAAGKVRDQHIRDLMLQPEGEADHTYWQNVSRLIATQLGNAERWQDEYAKLSGDLMGEVTAIKTRLIAVAAHVEVAQAARPLLQAQINLDTAARHLRISVGERASTKQRFAPRSEYVLPEQSG